jgi:hypothetical protein
MSRLAAAVVGAFLIAAPVLARGPVIIMSAGTTSVDQTVDFPAGSQAPPRDTAQSAKLGTATLRGRVFAADTGQPMRRAQVRITSTAAPGPQPPENRLATTDANGRYEFKELRAGRYNVTVSKPGGYMNVQYGQKRPFDPGRPLEIFDGQTVEQIDFSLPRGGVIAGRILDEFGEPVTDVQVTAARSQSSGGQRSLIPGGRPGTTNDVGEFRVFALAPGDYYLSATLRNNNGGNNDADNGDRTGYAPTYYPGTPDVGAAQRLTVAYGQTIGDITLTLLAVRTARISGTVVDSNDQPMRGNVQAVPHGELLGTLNLVSGQTRPDGSFTINGVAPGDYSLQVQSQGRRGQAADPEYASADVTVAGADISGIRLTAVKPSVISGRIIVGSGAPQSIRQASVRIAARPMPPAGGITFGPFPPPSPVNQDWTFQVKVRAGLVRLSAQGLQPPWSIKAVRYRGSDVTDAGVDVRANEDLNDVEIELTNRDTEVSGVVTNSRGEPVKDYWVVLFARDPDRWRPPSRYVRTSRSDQDGRFKTTGLPPGEYLVIAVETVDPNEATDPDFLGRIDSRASRFALGEGETRTLDLRLDSVP